MFAISNERCVFVCIYLQVIGKRFSDLVIVGRGIYQATDPCQNAELYKEKAFQEYMKSLQDQ